MKTEQEIRDEIERLQKLHDKISDSMRNLHGHELNMANNNTNAIRETMQVLRWVLNDATFIHWRLISVE